MLDQAIVDAQALREAALKNAEQSVIEKYSKQIKEAVDQMLEKEDPMAKVDEVINEAEEELNEEAEGPIAGMGIEPQGSQIEAPPSWDSRYDDMMTNFTALVDNLPSDDNGMIDLDLGDFEMSDEEEDALGQEDTEDMPIEDPKSDLEDLGGEEEGEDTAAGGEGLDDLLSEPLQEEINLDEVAEAVGDLLEEMELDYDPQSDSLGKWRNNRSREEHNQDAAEALYEEESSEEEAEEVDEEKEELMGKVNELHETVKNLTSQNNQLVDVLSKLEIHLEESLLSNAKLLYQNRTLSDASLNERQKSKIVEAISNAESPKEAKSLHETLRATVGSTPSQKKGPQSLSESVNRRSNLSSMLNSRQNIKESKSTDPLLEKMQKLAGIKK